MKRIALSTVLIVLMVILALWGFFVIKNCTESLERDIDNILAADEINDKDAVIEFSKRLEKGWDDFLAIKILVTDSEHCLEITSSIAKIVANAQSGEELKSECYSVKKLISYYYLEQVPDILNVL